MAAGRRHGLDLTAATTSHLIDVHVPDDPTLLVAVCDNAHEELTRTGLPGTDPADSSGAGRRWLHWHVPDPVRAGTDDAFETAYAQITQRVDRLAAALDDLPRRVLNARAPSTTARRPLMTDTTPRPSWATLPLDESLALRTAAIRLVGRLRRRLRRRDDRAVPAHLATTSSPTAPPSRNFLPLMAERFARQRLQRPGQGRGPARRRQAHRAVPVRAQRRPLADGAGLLHSTSPATAPSPGPAAPNPAPRSTRPPIAAMAELGIDISGEFPKPWTDEIVRAADVVITMGCGDACPIFPGKRYEDWDLDDPAGQDVDAVRPIRDEIERRVRALLDELGVPAA